MKQETVAKVESNVVKTDEIIQKIAKTSEVAVKEIKEHTTSLENSIKYRVSDCETLVKTRVTEEYVKVLGERIKQGIFDSVSNIATQV